MLFCCLTSSDLERAAHFRLVINQISLFPDRRRGCSRLCRRSTRTKRGVSEKTPSLSCQRKTLGGLGSGHAGLVINKLSRLSLEPNYRSRDGIYPEPFNESPRCHKVNLPSSHQRSVVWRPRDEGPWCRRTVSLAPPSHRTAVPPRAERGNQRSID